MKIKQVVCPQEDSMEEAAEKGGSTFPHLHTHMADAQGRPIHDIKLREKIKNKSLPMLR